MSLISMTVTIYQTRQVSADVMAIKLLSTRFVLVLETQPIRTQFIISTVT